MQNDFTAAVTFTLRKEGGLQSDPSDPGNAGGNSTKYGITLPTLAAYRKLVGKPVPTNIDVVNLTVLEATAIYKALFWAKMGGDSIADANVALVLFDASVLFGWPAAVKAAQQCVYTANGTTLVVDGNMGPKSIAALNSCGRRAFLQPFIFACLSSFLTQVEKDPARKTKWLPIWTDRAADWLTYAPNQVTNQAS